MSYPTGMGANTGQQFNQVARQMRAYLNGPGAQRPPSPFNGPPPFPPPPHISPFQGPFPIRPPMGPMFRPQRMPFNPHRAEGIGGFARLFLHNLLS
jgi:hypothetical protein